jgi:hypothetical protein
VRGWREAGYPGTAAVTRRLLEWWFERDEERRALGRRFFFCHQEAVETAICLYEVQGRRKIPETADLLRYALKLATGTGRTVVMALFVTWATLHKRKVSGSSLSTNFLVLVPNLTVRNRVSGQPRGDGLDQAGEHNLYDGFEMVCATSSASDAPACFVIIRREKRTTEPRARAVLELPRSYAQEPRAGAGLCGQTNSGRRPESPHRRPTDRRLESRCRPRVAAQHCGRPLRF